MKNKIALITVGLCLAFSISACGNAQSEDDIYIDLDEDIHVEKEEPDKIVEEIRDDNTEVEGIQGKIESALENIKDNIENSESDKESILEEKKEYFSSRLVDQEGVKPQNILTTTVSEYEGKDKYSAFIFVGEIFDEELNTYEGELWFVSDEETRLLHNSPNGYYNTGEIMSFDNTDKSFFYINEFYVTQAVSYVYYVENGYAYEANISRLGSVGPVESNDFTITFSAYDATYYSSDDMVLGHTWKPYYFHYDEKENTFVEYVGTEITPSKLTELVGFDMIADITAIGGIATEIYQRDNGIISVNYYIKEMEDNNSYSIEYNQANYDLNTGKYFDVWGEGENTVSTSGYGGSYAPGILCN